jgi:hypothetical protein
VSGKRCYNDAFNVSPDTTTPDTEPVIIINEIVRSEVIQRTPPPSKRRKTGEPAPKNVAKRSKGRPSSALVNRNNDDTTCDAFPPASASCSSSIPGPWVRQVLQDGNEPSSKYTQV